MKVIGIVIVFLLIAFQHVNAQPLEYSGSPSFCQRMFKYIQQKPDFRRKPRGTERYLNTVNQNLASVPITKNLPPIDSVFIRGGVDLEIMGGEKSRLTVCRKYEGLAIKVCNGAIYISYSKPVACNQNPRPIIKLYVNQLRQLVVAGSSYITGRHLDTYCGLTIEHCGSGCVNLNGPVHLVRVVSSGCASICVNHVVSPHVHIIAANSTTVTLMGSTGLLLVRAFQHGTVDTRFMCSNTAMVQAADQSLVLVKTLGSLRAFASGMSNIYYYAIPGELLSHNMLAGNVFPMCW